MDTAQVAQYLDTTPRTLRQFLRSNQSTFVAVGSGARYEFTEGDLATLRKRFADWKSSGSARSEKSTLKPSKELRPPRPTGKAAKDQKVWEEEGLVEMPDIRDPRIRKRVKADAAAAEARLEMALMAVGLHITQPGFNAPRKAS